MPTPKEAKMYLRLTEDVKNEFQGYADDLGISMSALATMVIGDYVRKMRKQREIESQMKNFSLDMIKQMADNNISEDKMQKMIQMAAQMFMPESTNKG